MRGARILSPNSFFFSLSLSLLSRPGARPARPAHGIPRTHTGTVLPVPARASSACMADPHPHHPAHPPPPPLDTAALRARLPRPARTRTARRLRSGTAAVTALLAGGLVLLHDWGPGPHVLSGVRPAVKKALNALYGVEAAAAGGGEEKK